MSSKPNEVVVDLLDDDEVVKPVENDDVVFLSTESEKKTRQDNAIVVSLVDETPNTFPISLYDLPRTSPIYPNLVAMHEILRKIVAFISFPVEVNWLFQDPAQYNQPILVFKSRTFPARSYTFRLTIPSSFPNEPPSLETLTLVPGLEFCVINNHPALSKRLWTAGTDLVDVFSIVLNHLDSMDYNFSRFTVPLVGESYQSGDTLEQLVADLYGCYAFELKGYKGLDKMIDKFIPADLCVCLGSLSGHQPAAKGSGTGYSVGHVVPGKGQPVSRESRIKTLVEEINHILGGWTKASLKKNTGPLLWLLQSPLSDLIAFLINECSREEIYRQAAYVGQLSTITLRLEWILAFCGDWNIGRQAEITQHLAVLYNKVLVAVELELFDKKPKWLKDLSTSSELYQQLQKDGSSAVGTMSKGGVSSEVDAAAASDAATTAAEPKPSHIRYMAGVELKHIMYNKGNAVEKCPKAWLRELQCIEDNLPDEVVLFVSEEHPNYLLAILTVVNDDCPYYGGCFVFHIVVPARYPQVPPKVLLGTTGEGTVRFNPNLYNCGKVCLSLLGTWQGEPWNPKESNMTQVLKSILYLIFVDEPFYNEPGYHRPAHGGVDPQSTRYSLEVMHNTLRFAILYHLQLAEDRYGPPEILQHIRDFYLEHWIMTPSATSAASTSSSSAPSSSSSSSASASAAVVPLPPSGIRAKLLGMYERFRGMPAADRARLMAVMAQIDAAVASKKRSLAPSDVQQQSEEPPAKRTKLFGIF